MKSFKSLASIALLASIATFAVVGCKSASSGQGGASMGTAAAKPYPLTKCIVSGEALEEGKAYTFVHNGQEIKLCCKDCLADFDKDPAKYLAKLSAPK